MTATQASSLVILAEIPQLTTTLVANAVYEFSAYITFRSAATTTGINLGFSAPLGSRPMLEIVVPIVSTASSNALSLRFPSGINTITGSVLGTGVTAANLDHTARIIGTIVTGGLGGNFQIQFASEVTLSAITLQVGSTITMTRIE